jgi:uncharacterized LabA/DUF88 family protein
MRAVRHLDYIIESDVVFEPDDFLPEERLAIFIDGANLYSAARGLAFDIDYKRLLDLFNAKGRLIRAFYYTALLEDQEYSPIRPLVDWLDYNGYTMVTKPTKEFTDAMGRRRIKGNMDIELATDMLDMAQHIDCNLFSGIHFSASSRWSAQGSSRMGRADHPSSPPMVSDDLRRQADNFIEIRSSRRVSATIMFVRAPPCERNLLTRRTFRYRNALAIARFVLVLLLSETQRAAHVNGLMRCSILWRSDRGAVDQSASPGLKGANRTGRPFTGDYAGGPVPDGTDLAEGSTMPVPTIV